MNFVPYIAPLSAAFVVMLGAIGLYLSNKAKNVDSYATGWQKVAKDNDRRLTIMEGKYDSLSKTCDELRDELNTVKDENRRLTSDNEAKIGRISILEKQVIDLQTQLGKYEANNTQMVIDAADHIHETVETEKNNIINSQKIS
jgi:septal ring factor EnvC (AmiA/AmiB activator)